MKVPTKEQIAFANDIAEVLGIDFPTSSKDYTSMTYYKFISDNLAEYQCVISGINEPDDWDWAYAPDEEF